MTRWRMPPALERDLELLEARLAGEPVEDYDGCAADWWRILAADEERPGRLFVLEGRNTGDVAIWCEAADVGFPVRTLEIRPLSGEVSRYVFTAMPTTHYSHRS